MRDVSIGYGMVSFHHAPIFGLICGLVGMDSGTSQRAYMFMTMRDVISAATRLNFVGPLGAAVLQHQIAPLAEIMSINGWTVQLRMLAKRPLYMIPFRAAMATCFLG